MVTPGATFNSGKPTNARRSMSRSSGPATRSTFLSVLSAIWGGLNVTPVRLHLKFDVSVFAAVRPRASAPRFARMPDPYDHHGALDEAVAKHVGRRPKGQVKLAVTGVIVEGSAQPGEPLEPHQTFVDHAESSVRGAPIQRPKKVVESRQISRSFRQYRQRRHLGRLPSRRFRMPERISSSEYA